MTEEKKYRCVNGHVTTAKPGIETDVEGKFKRYMCGEVVENVARMESYNFVTKEHTPMRDIPWMGWCWADCEEVQ